MKATIEQTSAQEAERTSSMNPYQGYSKQYTPLSSYLILMGTYVGALAVGGMIMKRRRRYPPEDMRVKDVVMLGVATQKVSRILTQERVTSSLRAPFTELEGPAGAGEVSEHARGHGLRRAVGDLVVCPWCANPWVASWFMFGYVFWPRQSRYVATIFNVVAVADFLNHGYAKAKELNE